MTSNAEPKAKRARKRTGTLSKQRTLRFGAAEETAIESVRVALSKTRGKPVSFSEAHRVLLLDKEDAARVEARALAMGAGPVAESPELVAALDHLADEVAALRVQVARVGGNLNQVAKRLNAGHAVGDDELRDALGAVTSLRHVAESLDDAAYKSTRTSRW